MATNNPNFNLSEILNLAQAEIRSCYQRLGISGSNVLDLIDEAYKNLKKIEHFENQKPPEGGNLYIDGL